jgi:hypothetical protein
MSDTPDFHTRATEQLRTMEGDDTVVLATMNGERMHLQTRAPRGPAEMVHIARRLLEEARGQYTEGEAAAPSAYEGAPLGELAEQIEDALARLPDLNAATDDGEG